MKPTSPRRVLGPIVVLLLVALTGCGSDSRSTTDDGADEASEGDGSSDSEVTESGSSGQDSTGTSEGSDTDTAADTAGAGAAAECGLSMPVMGADGQPTGFVSCENGGIDRPEVASCVPAGMGDCTFSDQGCSDDADCTERPNGICRVGSTDPVIECSCSYECTSDADCEADQICRCAGVGGGSSASTCIPADCKTDADCESGRCGLAATRNCNANDCSWSARMACRPDADLCPRDGGCGAGFQCQVCRGEAPFWGCASPFPDGGECGCPADGC